MPKPKTKRKTKIKAKPKPKFDPYDHPTSDIGLGDIEIPFEITAFHRGWADSQGDGINRAEESDDPDMYEDGFAQVAEVNNNLEEAIDNELESERLFELADYLNKNPNTTEGYTTIEASAYDRGWVAGNHPQGIDRRDEYRTYGKDIGRDYAQGFEDGSNDTFNEDYRQYPSRCQGWRGSEDIKERDRLGKISEALYEFFDN
jgi:hypothetical protein